MLKTSSKDNNNKPAVFVLTRVSTSEQDHERQQYVKDKIVRHFGLNEIDHEELTVSGTVVLKTNEYKRAIRVISQPTTNGLVVPYIDRWFRLKRDLISKWAKTLAAFVEPFEVLNEDGKTAKLIYTTLTASDGSQEYFALDLRNPKHQEILKTAIEAASKDRETIANRFSDGKESARANPEMKVDGLPYGVEFVPYPGQNRYDENGRRKTRLKGYFKYNDYAYQVVKPVLERYAAGEAKYTLCKEYQPLAASFGYSIADPQSIGHILNNKWWLGFKHRTTKRTAEFNEETQRFKATRIELDASDEAYFEIATNLAGWSPKSGPGTDATIPRTPLISKEIWDKVQARVAEGAENYGRRQRHDLEVLAHPLFCCPKCGAKMTYVKGSQTDRKNKRQGTYVCLKRRHDGIKACDQPIVNAARFDAVVSNFFIGYLTNAKFLDAKFEEQSNIDHTAEAKAEVARRKVAVEEIEKRLTRLRRVAEESDDIEIPGRIRQLNSELASARTALSVAQAEVNEKPVLDKEAAKLAIWWDLANYAQKPMEERKALLQKYVTKISLRTSAPTEYEKRILAAIEQHVFQAEDGRRKVALMLAEAAKESYTPVFTFKLSAPVIEAAEDHNEDPTPIGVDRVRTSHRATAASAGNRRITTQQRSRSWYWRRFQARASKAPPGRTPEFD